MIIALLFEITFSAEICSECFLLYLIFRDFQVSLDQLDATWDFSGYPCPMRKYEWAIRRIDGKEMQPFTNVESKFIITIAMM